jgi:subtilisin-like proprotein convertase family protein
MESTVFRADFLPNLQQNGYGNERLSMIFSYSHPDLGDDSDFIDGARFTNIAVAVENSAKAFEIEIGIKFTQLYMGDARITINSLDPSQPLDASKF